MNKKLMSKLLIIIAIIAVSIMVYKSGLASDLKNINHMQVWFRKFGAKGYIIYILIYILSCVLMLPGSVLTIIAGAAYGPVTGAIIALIGATLGASASFLIAKYIMKDTIKSVIGKSTIFDKVDNGFKENGYNFLILTRLVPIFPFNVQNYAYGLTGISTCTYIFWTFICMIPGAFIYTYMAGEIVLHGVSLDIFIKFTIAGIILFIISFIPKYIAKKRGIRIC